MKIHFKTDKSPKEIVALIEDKISGRKLGKMLKFNLDGKTLSIEISKLGKSNLQFAVEDGSDETSFNLEKEKIAFSHKAFRNEVVEKIKKVVADLGGKTED